MVDFGIYNAIWALWHLGMPAQVFAVTHQFQPERFPKVEDNAVMVLTYPDSVGVFESSWALPRGSRSLEVSGSDGSFSLSRDSLAYRERRGEARELEASPLPEADRNPIRHVIDRLSRGRPPGHITAIDINVDAVQVLEAAKLSARQGRAISLPLPVPAAD